MNMTSIRNVILGLKPTILMLIAQTILSVRNVLFKLASNDGSDLKILVAYRFLFAAAFMVPVAFFVERWFSLSWLSINFCKFVLKFCSVLQKQKAEIDMESDLAIVFVCLCRVRS